MPLKKVNTVQHSLLTSVKRLIKFGIQDCYSNFIRCFLPYWIYWLLLSSYLNNIFFLVRHKNEVTRFTNILSGVPQESVLGPILYTLYTSDLPQSNSSYTATYVDDTVILSCHRDKYTASQRLELNLNDIDIWLRKWRINQMF